MKPSSLADRQALLLSLIIILLLILVCGGMSVYVISDPALEQAYVLTKAAQTIDTKYIDGITCKQLVQSARDGMLGLLDRFSGYVTAEDFDQFREEMTGAYAGLGVSVIANDQGLLIMSVRPDGPAHKVGLKAGDVILAADSIELAYLSATESTRLLRGQNSTNVLVRVLQPLSSDTFEVSITRAEMPIIHVPYAGFTPDSAIYIRLTDFEAGASKQLRTAIDTLMRQSASPPTGLILDLRGNPGGLFQEAWKSASLFLSEGTFIVGTDARSRWNSEKIYASGPDITGDLPLIMLVDKGSASSSEILAGSLQQAGRAILVGDTTFGKGLVQGFVTFPDGDGLRLTISRFYFDNNVYINEFDTALNEIGHGLPPDYLFDFPERNDYIRAIEHSLLLYQFAHLHQQDIISARGKDQAMSVLIDSLGVFMYREGFVYVSSRTQELSDLFNTAQSDDCTRSTERIISHALDLSVREDYNQLHHNAAYFVMRLQQVAWEQAYGTYRTYHEITVPQRMDIRYAESLLRDHNFKVKHRH